MGGCCGNSAARQAQNPTYHAILKEIYELVPFEEQQLKFSRRQEIMKYYGEYQWERPEIIFKVKTKDLMEHIEAYKIRLIDTSYYLENKITITQNPIVLKMSIVILGDLVSNLSKFVVNKEVLMTVKEEDSKVDSLRVPQQNNTHVTYISDNFLRFELIFSSILQMLINQRQNYNFIWFDLVTHHLSALTKFSRKPFQSEYINRINDYYEFILCKLLTQHQPDTHLEIEQIFEQSEVEENASLNALIDDLDEAKVHAVFKTYLETLRLTSYDKMFFSKNQKTLFTLFLLFLRHKNDFDFKKTDDCQLSQNCSLGIQIFINRALNLKIYDELYNSLYQNYDIQFWTNFKFIQGLTDHLFDIAKHEGSLKNIQIYFLSKFLDYLNGQQDLKMSRKASDNMKKSQPMQQENVNSTIKHKIINLLTFMFNQIKSNQFLLFYEENIIRTVIATIKLENDQSIIDDSKQCLASLLQTIVPDTNAFITFITYLIEGAYDSSIQLVNSKIELELNSKSNQLLEILNSILQKANLFTMPIFIKDDILYQLLQMMDSKTDHKQHCCHALFKLFTFQKLVQSIINEIDYNNEEHDSFCFVFSMNNQHFIPFCVLQHAIHDSQIDLLADFLDIVSLRSKKLGYEGVLSLLQVALNKEFRGKAYCVAKMLQVVSQNASNSEIQQWAWKAQKKVKVDVKEELKKQKGMKCIAKIEASVMSEISENTKYYVELIGGVNYEEMNKVYRNFLTSAKNEDQLNLDEIQINEEDKQSMHQSQGLNSFIDMHPDESFEKILQTVKKQKQKEIRLDHITSEIKDEEFQL